MIEQDALYDIELVASAPTTISSATVTNFDIPLPQQDFTSAKAYLKLVSKASGTSIAMTALKFASDDAFSSNVITYDSTNDSKILKNDRDSSTAPFAQTLLTAAGTRSVAFGNMVMKSNQKYARAALTTIGGSVSLVAQVIWVIKKVKAPVVQA